MTDSAPLAPLPASPAAADPSSAAPAGGPSSDFTLEQTATLTRWLAEADKLPQEQAGPKSSGLPVETTQPAADPNDPLGAFAAAPAKAFELPNLTDIAQKAGATVDDAQLMQVDATLRGHLAAFELPAGIGNFAAAEMAKVNAFYPTMNEPTRQLYRQEQMAQLERTFGPELPAKLALARQLVREAEAKSPGIVALLDETGGGNSAAIATQLIRHAERLLARAK